MTILKKAVTTILLGSALFSTTYAEEQEKSLADILSSSGKKVKMSASGAIGARYFEDTKSGTQILQNLVTLHFAVDFDGRLQLIGDAMTGGQFKGGMNVFHTIDGQKEPMQEIHIRRLFARTKIGDDISLEAGALVPTDDKGSLVGIGKMGFIDGGRVVYQTNNGDKIEVTAGKLNGVTDVDVFERGVFDFDSESAIDIIEVKISGKLFDAISYQAGVESLDDEIYGKVITKGDVEIVSGHLVKLVAEGMVNFETDGYKARVGFETEVMKAFSKNQSGIILYADYMNTSDDFGLHNKYVFLDGQGTGEKVRVGVKATVNKKKKVSIYANFIQDINTGEHQLRSGFLMKFSTKKKKKPVKPSNN